MIRNHLLSIETTYGNVYCAACRDFVYDPELDAVAEQGLNKQSISLGLGTKYQVYFITTRSMSRDTHKLFFSAVAPVS